MVGSRQPARACSRSSTSLCASGGKPWPESTWFYRALVAAAPLSVVCADRRLGNDRGPAASPGSSTTFMRTSEAVTRGERDCCRLRQPRGRLPRPALAAGVALGAGSPFQGRRPDAFSTTCLSCFALVWGLALYTVLGGADFGAGFLAARRRQGRARADEIRDHAPSRGWRRSGRANPRLADLRPSPSSGTPPTRPPSARLRRRLSVPLFIAGIGIVMRGGAYALRAGTATVR